MKKLKAMPTVCVSLLTTDVQCPVHQIIRQTIGNKKSTAVERLYLGHYNTRPVFNALGITRRGIYEVSKLTIGDYPETRSLKRHIDLHRSRPLFISVS